MKTRSAGKVWPDAPRAARWSPDGEIAGGTPNRLEAHAIFLDFSMPLYVKMPPGAPKT